MRSIVDNAELALLLEVAGTPKPGNVDREREYDDLRFEHFLAGAVGARAGLELAADPDGPPIGEAFERAVEGMSDQRGGNTQFGALLLLVPLVRAAARDDLSPSGAREVAESTTVTDAAGFYRAFEHVDVSVDDPPADLDDLDVRRGSDAVPALHARGLALDAVMERSADRDGVAREWVEGFPRSFHAAERLGDLEGPVPDRAAQVFLELLSDEPDTFVAINHDETTAERVSARARAVLEGDGDADALAEDLIDREINPGTTADIVAAGLFVALERGLDV
ncbi:triphosphoribosyl-dephospho-CoA synthase [Halapricum hydrolyticum]|uniref:Triphosphoribosyl-dephospho-CoA synthase n=1 Tax=Halapricum hydrolyticum TaxID=2979991 RepID=A0AAE3IDM6_9EURY|nr:triphosphoribosyl-dephospho-CoA synthase [Halapricum hydrolyticum]MCU4719250.1 triphosphoribosyl-dephospho-CoA synthase [Halapricum hydrolyticum]MCU4728317.1 triphosphoribosyl-dephospho-CoA synthase [Halapricum hydrolyticum]